MTFSTSSGVRPPALIKTNQPDNQHRRGAEKVTNVVKSRHRQRAKSTWRRPIGHKADTRKETHTHTNTHSKEGSDHSPLLQVDLGLLEDDVGEATANTKDLGDGVHDVGGTINVRIQDTKDVVELLGNDRERHDEKSRA